MNHRLSTANVKLTCWKTEAKPGEMGKFQYLLDERAEKKNQGNRWEEIVKTPEERRPNLQESIHFRLQ